MRQHIVERYHLKTDHWVITVFLGTILWKLLHEFFSQILKTDKIGVLFWERFLSIYDEIYFYRLLWISLVFSGVKAFLGFYRVFLCALEGSHLLAHIKWLFVRSADIAQHCRFIIRCTEGSFVEDEAFVLSEDSFAI
jgi:hypothetical protein